MFCFVWQLACHSGEKKWWYLNLKIWMRSYSSGFILGGFFFFFFFIFFFIFFYFLIKKRFGKKKNNREIRVRKLEILLRIKRDKRNI